MMDARIAPLWANYYAQMAHYEHFSCRRGVWYIESLNCLLLYDNNPYVADASRPAIPGRSVSSGILGLRAE
jgi:hypothetical protein